MRIDKAIGSEKLRVLLEQARVGISTVSQAAPPAERPDGRHILDPMICSTGGTRVRCAGALGTTQMRALHNEGGREAALYPLSLDDNLFFTEAAGSVNPDADRYLDLVCTSIGILSEHMRDDPMSFSTLLECGRAIQEIDVQFAAARIGKPLDSIHRCVGPDPKHPYSKITVCRTTFPVNVGGAIVPFFFEKFLVAYSFLDENQKRRSTQTPIHAHPLNFETGYFISFGPKSVVIEQEYLLVGKDGEVLSSKTGMCEETFLVSKSAGGRQAMRITPGDKHFIKDHARPRKLEPFESEVVLQAHGDLIGATDGLFRPHQVTVIDDPEIETRYFALDNYFGPVGRVLVFEGDSVAIWSHSDWDKPTAE